MTRLDELTLKLADTELSESETEELAVLLRQDARLLEAHVRLLELEANLRGRRTNMQLAEATMARLRSHLAGTLADRVMSEVKTGPEPDWLRRGEPSTLAASPARRRRSIPAFLATRPGPITVWSLALAASVAVLLGLSSWFFGPTMGEPVLAEVLEGSVTLERAGQTIAATAGARLQLADMLRTGTNAKAAVTFGPEKTRLELRADTELKLLSWSKGKRFELAEGTIEAVVAYQRPFRPMLARTPQAEARVLGTRFTLAVNTNATRLEVSEGKVRFTRASDNAAVTVAEGNYAVAAASYELAPQPLTGSILREYWTNLSGDYYITFLTSHPNFPDHPSGRENLDKFEAPSHWGTNYGARIRGYLHPPRTGEYTFWIAAGDGGELWFSPDDNPNNKQQIGNAEGCKPHEWTKLRKQQSSAITLVAGRKYYIEALHKQGKKGDHLAVAWQGPDREREVIPGEFLSPPESKTKDKKR